MVPEFIYYKIRTEVNPDGQEQIVDRHVFFTEEAYNADRDQARENYPGKTEDTTVASVNYYKAKVQKTPL